MAKASTAKASKKNDPKVLALQSGMSTTEATGLSAASLKNFRHHPEMENFYQFIYKNDLRFEALKIIDGIIVEKQALKAAGEKATQLS